MIKINAQQIRNIIFGTVRVAGPIATGILAFKAGMKAIDAMEVSQYEFEVDGEVNEDGSPVTEMLNYDDLDRKEKIKVMAPIVLPAAIACAGTIACSLIDKHIDSKHIKELGGLYSVALLSASAYKEKLSMVDPDSVPEIEEKIKTKAKELKLTDRKCDVIEHSKNGGSDSLFYEPISGRYFISDKDKVEKALANTMKDYERSGDSDNCRSLDLNTLYAELGIETSWMGWQYGWCSCEYDDKWDNSGEKIDLHLTQNPDGTYWINYGNMVSNEEESDPSLPFFGWYEY